MKIKKEDIINYESETGLTEITKPMGSNTFTIDIYSDINSNIPTKNIKLTKEEFTDLVNLIKKHFKTKNNKINYKN